MVFFLLTKGVIVTIRRRVNFRFAPYGLVTLTVLPQTFKNSHFPPINGKTDNLDGVRGREQNGKTIANYWRKMAIFKGLGQNR
ncbi:hypothetical protein Hanom_Chr04g00287011 [Helianthus anomalus]